MINTPLTLEGQQEYYLKKLPENVPSLLISSVYIGERKSVFLKFYNPTNSQIYFWSDFFITNNENRHQPYCFVKEPFFEQAESIAEKESNRFKLEKVKKTR
jgi:DNA polymerase I